MVEIYFKALLMGFGLIIALGAQNIFIIKIGLQRNNVMLASLVASLCDVTLIVVGTLFMSLLTVTIPYFLPITKWLGCAYLAFYGLMSLINSLRANPKGWDTIRSALTAPQQSIPLSAGKIIVAVLFFSYLNPHVIIDTLIILGNVGSKLPNELKGAFIAGAATASFIWFFTIGFCSQKASVFFTNVKVVKLFDFISAMIMFFIAFQLATFDVQLS
ncbi:L-lysine exporter family protein LysE/ArgO [Orbus hercynius]|uniref:L-lysine exporter family protein LysE/ArgO n=1 Tax=Orbus hercynius TaxID=593135 RepID=A0A495RIR7_9GAMM|nr:LysE family transporter [Orbus hercynius]RKS87442.1 L-lysine exporter family protein LysE/ArgO [Orbus hercynius]